VGKTAASPPAPALPPGEGAPTARHRHDAHGRGRLVVGLRYIYAATRRRSVGRQRSVTTSPPVHCHHRRQQPLGIAAAFSWRLSQGTEVRPVRACVRACVQRAVGEWGSVLGPEASWRTSERWARVRVTGRRRMACVTDSVDMRAAGWSLTSTIVMPLSSSGCRVSACAVKPEMTRSGGARASDATTPQRHNATTPHHTATRHLPCTCPAATDSEAAPASRAHALTARSRQLALEVHERQPCEA
jgi:hypothetical protein